MIKKKRYVVKDQTRQRCQITKISDLAIEDYMQVSMELFHFLFNIEKVPFSLYFRVESELIEFMRPEETSKELLNQLQSAVTKDFEGVAVMIRKRDHKLFQDVLDHVRRQKINKLLAEAPHLDRKTLELFNDLSKASQMVVRGGVTGKVVNTVAATASKLVSNLMDNSVAIGTLSRMVHHDPTLYDHSASVAMIASVIAGKLLKKPIPRQAQELVARSGLYHDVGKTCVPSHILNKPGKFTPEEFEVMKTHTVLGYDELMKAREQGAEIHDLVALVALQHHERFTGKGYPYQKKGRAEDDPANGIHLFTRIVTIADVYSALLMKRVYKPAYEAGQAIKIMSDSYQDDYDPEIFIPFLKHVVKALNETSDKMNGGKGRILMMDGGKIRLSS